MPKTTAEERLDESLDSRAYDSLSLDEWITKFGRIYGKRHDKHTTEYMISRLVEEVAELVNPMESQDPAEIGPSLADVFSWICSIAYKLNIDLSALAWQKYGGRDAPHPAWATSQAKVSEFSSQTHLASFSQPETLREWQSLISNVYRKENSRLTPMNALLAMMKDVGDLAMLNRKRAPQESVTSKLSAILAWSLTISQLLRLDLAELVNRKYDDHCPSCLQTTCDTDICHPLANLFVSFGPGVSDEEKYTVLEAASKFGYRAIVNPSTLVQNTRDLSTSLDLISRSDAACIVLSGRQKSNALGLGQTEYGQFFEVLSCYSILSKGNVWIFAKDEPDEFRSYLETSFSTEKIAITKYTDAGNMRARFEDYLLLLNVRKEKANTKLS